MRKTLTAAAVATLIIVTGTAANAEPVDTFPPHTRDASPQDTSLPYSSSPALIRTDVCVSGWAEQATFYGWLTIAGGHTPDFNNPVGTYEVCTDAPATAPVRLSGGDRYATAVAISQAAFPAGAEAVYLVNGASNVDALPGAVFGDGPILYVTRDTLPADVAAEIVRLNPARVVALGGVGVVSDTVLSAAVALTS